MMKSIGMIMLSVVLIGMNLSCKKESIADYVSYREDVINNPNGFLEDYGQPYNLGVNVSFFRNSNWKITVSSTSAADLEYQMFVELSNLKVYQPSNPINYYFASFSSNEPYKASNLYASNEIDFTISNADKRLSGRWFKFGNSNRLIMARNGVTLIFTRL